MSTKIEKPVLQGQRIKTRKRDEKVKWDPVAFRDNILCGFSESGSDLEALYKYLVTAATKLDVKRYGETLFDVLIAGGILAPGGTVSEVAEDSKPFKTDFCLFNAESDITTIKKWAQLFQQLIRRYKYLEMIFGEEIGKLMSFMHGFSVDNRNCLARSMVFWISDSILQPTVLSLLLKEHLLKDMVAGNFISEFFSTWLSTKDMSSLKGTLKKASIETKLMDFLPSSKRTDAYFAEFFTGKGLTEIVSYQKQQAVKVAKRDMQTHLTEMIQNNETNETVLTQLKEINVTLNMADAEVVAILWPTIMAHVEWNKKGELLEQVINHLRKYVPLLEPFTVNSSKAQMTLMLRIQEYCYENMNLMKTFSKVILLFYKADVLHEEVIIRWYSDMSDGKAKGKTVFLDQMKPFIEWLKSAEEEDEESDED